MRKKKKNLFAWLLDYCHEDQIAHECKKALKIAVLAKKAILVGLGSR